MNELSQRLYAVGILPVAVIEHAQHAVPLCDALLAAGLYAIEVTFRTQAAAAAMAAIAKERPQMLLGAGTVLTIEQAETAVKAGAKFIVTPGLNPQIVSWCQSKDVPVYPGVSTPTEIEAALALGLTELKFFPAEQSGGVSMLKALAGPYQQVKFIPTGGISAQNLNAYLDLPNVLCCGGSFMVPTELAAAGDFAGVEALCNQAVTGMIEPQLLHVGMNCADADDARGRAIALQRLFGFVPKELPGAWFAGSIAELVKAPFLGEHGHLAFSVNHMERTMAWFRVHGVAFRKEGGAADDKGTIAIYLEEEVGGFAIHLRRRD